MIQARIQKFFKEGVEEDNFERESLLIHVSTRVHIKTRQTCNSFSLLSFQEDCLLFFALFNYSLLFLKFKRGVWNPRNPPSRSANVIASYGKLYIYALTVYFDKLQYAVPIEKVGSVYVRIPTPVPAFSGVSARDRLHSPTEQRKHLEQLSL